MLLDFESFLRRNSSRNLVSAAMIRVFTLFSVFVFLWTGATPSYGALRTLKSKKPVHSPLRSLRLASASVPQFTVSPTFISVSCDGTTNGLVSVVAESGDWGVSNPIPWITVQVTSSPGSSNGIVTYTVAANLDCTNRAGSFFVKTQAVTVTQAGVAGFYSLSSGSSNFDPNGGNGSVFLTANCSWDIQKDVSWITSTSPMSGVGSANISYLIASNTSSLPRTGSIKVLDKNSAVQQTLSVTQAGVPPTHVLSSSTASFSFNGGTSNVLLTATAGWSLQADVNWVASISPLSGNSSASISYIVLANTNHSTRTGTIKVLDLNSIVQQTLVVSEAAAPITHLLSFTDVTFGPGTAISNVQLTATAPWTVQTDVAWITSILPTSGNGNATIGFSLVANTNLLARMGSIKILSADSAVQQVLTVTQGGAAGYYLSSTNASFTSSAGSSNVQLTALASWIVQTDVDWINGLLPVSGAGNATINYSVVANNSCGSRSGLIKILDANQLLKGTLLVTQAGRPTIYTLSSTYLLFPSSGGRISVNLTASCTWTAVSDVPWINAIIPSNGNTNATIAYTVDSNMTLDGRSGYLRIRDGNGVVQQSLRIIQSGATPVFWFSPTSDTFPASGGSSSVSLVANSTWVAQSDVSWISGINPSSGSGDAILNYTVGPNTNSSTRSGTIKVLDNTFTVQDTLTIFQAGTGVSAPLKNSPASGSYLWSSAMGSTNNDWARAVAVDAEGSVFAAGSMSGSVYLEKISAAGKPIWSKWFSGTGQANAVALDKAGNIYLGGNFSGTVDFDSVLLSASGVSDVFVSKYSADGVQLWAKSFGGGGDNSIDSLALNEDTIVLTGVFTSSINFGDAPENSLISGGAKDIFVATLSSVDGKHVWSQRFGSGADDVGKSVAIDSQGNIAISGSFHGAVNFGGGLLSGEGTKGFVAMYSKSGSPLWSKVMNYSGSSLAIDLQGNVFVIGLFEGNANGGAALFLEKFAGAMDLQPGADLWSKEIEVSSPLAGSVAVDSKGNVSISGSYLKAADSLNQSETNNAASDIFVVKFSSEGTRLWSKSFDSSGSDNSYGLCHDAKDNVIIVGAFSGSIDFGGGEQTSSGGSDFLVLKLAH